MAEITVFFSSFPQANGSEGDEFCGVSCASAKFPTVRRKEPGPTQSFPGAQALDANVSPARYEGFQRHMPFVDKVEMVGVFPFPENYLPGIKPDKCRALLKEMKEPRIEPGPKRMLRNGLLQIICLHVVLLRADGCRTIATLVRNHCILWYHPAHGTKGRCSTHYQILYIPVVLFR